ncbi:hypothetical protein ANN_07864 [Periplaneta americana]|uniref:Reverse transcriptase n=1 Tax=Periplaneta americana TaxID=6978 RepID=A0ABQ8SZT7_PERAM|nr:hypothetical protein ANN_07864 [Periplaneta americana]
MTSHVSSARSLPGRTRDKILCRRCHREPETLAHVLGSCPHGEVLGNSRHHRIRSMIAEQFRSINFQVFEEVHGLADNGSTRRIDMIDIPPNNNNGYIIDPTVRFEKQKSQPEDVNREKNIYVRTVPYFMDKYGLQQIEVIGLMVGARGTIPGFFFQTWQRFGLQRKATDDIVLAALRGSIFILRNHLYGILHYHMMKDGWSGEELSPAQGLEPGFSALRADALSSSDAGLNPLSLSSTSQFPFSGQPSRTVSQMCDSGTMSNTLCAEVHSLRVKEEETKDEHKEHEEAKRRLMRKKIKITIVNYVLLNDARNCRGYISVVGVPEFCPAVVLLHASKSTDMNLSHLSTLKCHRPGPGSNLQARAKKANSIPTAPTRPTIKIERRGKTRG